MTLRKEPLTSLLPALSHPQSSAPISLSSGIHMAPLGLPPSILSEGLSCPGQGTCASSYHLSFLCQFQILVHSFSGPATFPGPSQVLDWGWGQGAWATADVECAHRSSRTLVFFQFVIVLNRRLPAMSHFTVEVPYEKCSFF